MCAAAGSSLRIELRLCVKEPTNEAVRTSACSGCPCACVSVHVRGISGSGTDKGPPLRERISMIAGTAINILIAISALGQDRQTDRHKSSLV